MTPPNPAPAPCFICGKQKGQPPERCNGHYDTAPGPEPSLLCCGCWKDPCVCLNAPAPELPESKLAEMEERQCPTSADLLLMADSVADRLLDVRKESMIASQIAYDVASRAWRDGYKKGWEEARTELPEAVEQIRRLRAEVAELRKSARPLIAFLEAFERKPIKGLHESEIYGIHGGDVVKPDGASLRWEYLRDLREAAKESK